MNKRYLNPPNTSLALGLLASIVLANAPLALAQPAPTSQKLSGAAAQNESPPQQGFACPIGGGPGCGKTGAGGLNRGGLNRPDSWGQQQGPGQGKGRGLFAAMRDLNLSPEQKQQLLASRPERQQMREVVMRVKEEKQKLQDVIARENAPESEIQTQAVALKQALSAAVDAKIRTALSLKKILTPEQFASFQAKMQEL